MGVIHNLSPKSDLESQVGGWDWELWGKFTGARVAQWIRRRSPKPKIGGSSPPVGTEVFKKYFWHVRGNICHLLIYVDI